MQLSDDESLPDDQILRTSEEATVFGQWIISEKGNLPRLTFKLESFPLHGAADVNADGFFSYTPDEGFVGTDRFTIHSSTPGGFNRFQNIRIYVEPQLDKAYRLKTQVATYANTPVSSHVVEEGMDDEQFTYGIAATPNDGTVVLHPDGHYVYTPHVNFLGTDHFKVSVTNKSGHMEVSRIDIQVHEFEDLSVEKDILLQEECFLDGVVNFSSEEPTQVLESMYEEEADSDQDQDQEQDQESDPEEEAMEDDEEYTDESDAMSYEDEYGTGIEDSEKNEGLDRKYIRTKRMHKVLVHTDVGIPIQGSVKKPTKKSANKAAKKTANKRRNLAYQMLTRPNHGKAKLNKSGKWTYEPNEGYVGKDRFIVLAADRKGRMAVSQVTIQMKEPEEE